MKSQVKWKMIDYMKQKYLENTLLNFYQMEFIFGHYKNYGENSMKVSLDNGLTIKVSKGCGIVNGADYELETDTLFILDRPASGERKDRVVVKVDDTLAKRKTELYVKEGNGTTLATLQRDDNIYEICIAEVTVKSTTNLTETDIVDTRLDKDLCGIVNSLISVDGEELYQKFQAYINTVTENLVRKDQNATVEGKIIFQNGIEGNLKGDVEGNVKGNLEGNAETATSANYANNAGSADSCSGNANTATTASSSGSCTRKFSNSK